MLTNYRRAALTARLAKLNAVLEDADRVAAQLDAQGKHCEAASLRWDVMQQRQERNLLNLILDLVVADELSSAMLVS